MSARWWALALIPATLSAQVRLLPDPTPPRSFGWSLGAARIIQGGGGHPGTLSQFDSVGGAPIGRPGDPVTVYLFADGENLSGVLHGTITARRRFDPPASWRLACDDLAHPGWLFSVSPRPTTQYALAVAGVSPRPALSAPRPSRSPGHTSTSAPPPIPSSRATSP